jgi:hypothetical protein
MRYAKLSQAVVEREVRRGFRAKASDVKRVRVSGAGNEQ